MPYWGKVIGTVAGLATLRPWLALLGLVLGHQFDRGFADRYAKLDRGGRLGRVPENFTRALFLAMGCLAKADGRVTEDEIRAARTLMHRLGLAPARVRHAMDWFQAGKEPGFPLLGTVRGLRRELGRNEELRRLFVRLLLEVSLSKGRLPQRERALLWSICGELEVSRVDLAQMEAMLRAQRGFRQSPQGVADAERVAAAYAMLGVSKNASNDEIKQAYRRLMNRNHPDKLSGSDADAGTLAAAQKRTRAIRGAYEMLKVRRSIR
ncbi:MAG TPA: co-chaperone DjlA [Woeseiaceae bacterium]|nr:co-chaperone DjlA [Woeseiaceae bacterium]